MRKRISNVVLLFNLDTKVDRARVRGILRFTQLHPRWSVTLLPDHPANRTGHEEMLRDVDGILTNEYTFTHYGIGSAQWRGAKNLVIFDCNSDVQFIPGASQVNLDYDSAACGKLAASYFVRHGFTHLAYVHTLARRRWSDTRAQAFADEARRLGAISHVYIPPTDVSTDDDRALGDWLEGLPKPCGVLGANDSRAMLVSHLCQQRRIEIPGQIAIMGVDNNDLACDFTRPALSSLEMDDDGAGFAAATILDRLMRGETEERQITLTGNYRVVERDSTLDPKGTARIVMRARQFLEGNFRSPIDVKDAAKAVGVSRRTLERRFLDAAARPPAEELRELRLAEMKRLLLKTTSPIREIAEQSGFAAAESALLAFRKRFGCTPGEFRRKN